MSRVFECIVSQYGFMPVNKEGSKLGFCGGGYDVLDDLVDGVDIIFVG